MKKHYGYPVIVNNNEKDVFMAELRREIEKFQIAGYEVEVQYSAHYSESYNSSTRYTALLLPYKEEKI